MADILIKGLSMPKDGEMLCIDIAPSGKVSISLDLKCTQIAEAVEIVHCKDCENWVKGYCEIFEAEWLTDDDFCKFGRRTEHG